MSFKNLFRTRPSGVVSKKAIGDLKILDNIVPCSFVAALSVATIAMAIATMTEPDWRRPRTP